MLCTSSIVIFLSLHVQEMLMCEYVITYHNVSFITVWCDVVYVFMCTRKREGERENTVYVASTVSHACVYNILKSHVSKVLSFIQCDIPIKTQMLHIMDVILNVPVILRTLEDIPRWVNRQMRRAVFVGS